MAYEYNPVSSKVQPNQAPNTKGFSPAGTSGNAKFIPAYSSSGYWSLFNSQNRIKEFQNVFKMNKSPLPVFLRGPRDVLMYRGIMIFSLVGIGIAMGSIYRMATGSITKKEPGDSSH